MRNNFSCASAAVTALLALTSCGTAPPQAPNVLLIVIDTLRADHLSLYGYPRVTSPTLDALAAESVVYTDAMAQAPVTIPSVLQILTGRQLVRKWIPADQKTFAETLADNGYATMAVVDNPVIESSQTRLERGFQSFFKNDILDERLSQQHWKTKTPADVITQRAIRWLDGRDPEQAFFAWLHYFDPHDPYFPPFTQDLTFADASDSTWNGDIRRNPIANKRAKPGAGVQPSPADRQRLLDLYDAEIAYLDRSLADLFAYLREQGLWEDTLVVVTADHGESFGERGEWTHGRSLYQSQVHVPLLVKLPHPDTNARRVDTPVQLIDIVPTLCAYLGIPCSEGTNGRDVLTNTYEDAYTLWNYWIAVREGSWKLIYNTVDDSSRLYDLASDPEERNDRSRSDPEPLARLLARKNAWLESRWPSSRATIEQSREQVEQLEALGYLE